VVATELRYALLIHWYRPPLKNGGGTSGLKRTIIAGSGDCKDLHVGSHFENLSRILILAAASLRGNRRRILVGKLTLYVAFNPILSWLRPARHDDVNSLSSCATPTVLKRPQGRLRYRTSFVAG
jgi:hypothetical protein